MSRALPWSDLKVAFGITNPERYLKAHDRGAAPLPAGWSLTEIDGSGARWVIVFRVEEVIPTVEDARTVAALIRRFGR